MVNKKIFQKGYISLCKRLHVYATCLRTHIIQHMINKCNLHKYA